MLPEDGQGLRNAGLPMPVTRIPQPPLWNAVGRLDAASLNNANGRQQLLLLPAHWFAIKALPACLDGGSISNRPRGPGPASP